MNCMPLALPLAAGAGVGALIGKQIGKDNTAVAVGGCLGLIVAALCKATVGIPYTLEGSWQLFGCAGAYVPPAAAPAVSGMGAFHRVRR